MNVLYMINHKRRKSLSFTDFNPQNFRPFITAQHLQLLKSSPQETTSSSFPFQTEKKSIILQAVNVELGSFKRKLSNYLQQHQNSRKNGQKKKIQLKGDGVDNLKSTEPAKMQTCQANQAYFTKFTNNCINRKSIRECIKGWSANKQKQKNQEKYIDPNLQILRQENQQRNKMSKSVLIVKQFDKQKRILVLKKKQSFGDQFCKSKQVPIHHTQLFFHRKKKCKTENNSDKQLKLKNQINKNNITIEEVLKMRSHIRSNFMRIAAQEKNNLEQQESIDISISVEKEDKKLQIDAATKKCKNCRRLKKNKEVQVVNKEVEGIQISPWQRHRQNTNDFQSFQ